MQSPCSEVQLDPLLNTNLKHVIVYVRTQFPPVFNYPQLWLASAIPRNLLQDNLRAQHRCQQAREQQQQQQQQQQQARRGFLSFVEPPPNYEDVVTPRMEDVTDDDGDDNDADAVVVVSDADDEREAGNEE